MPSSGGRPRGVPCSGALASSATRAQLVRVLVERRRWAQWDRSGVPDIFTSASSSRTRPRSGTSTSTMLPSWTNWGCSNSSVPSRYTSANVLLVAVEDLLPLGHGLRAGGLEHEVPPPLAQRRVVAVGCVLPRWVRAGPTEPKLVDEGWRTASGWRERTASNDRPRCSR